MFDRCTVTLSSHSYKSLYNFRLYVYTLSLQLEFTDPVYIILIRSLTHYVTNIILHVRFVSLYSGGQISLSLRYLPVRVPQISLYIMPVYIYLIHTNWWRKFMVNSKLVVDKKSAPDYLLINTVINRQQRLSSSNFHKIQTHLNRPILYIGLIVKYKTILILKSKNLTCGLWYIMRSGKNTL
jgi:hypothetical protein